MIDATSNLLAGPIPMVFTVGHRSGVQSDISDC